MSRRGHGTGPDAPVVVRLERELDAPPARIWEVFSAVDEWPRWQRRVRFASLEGRLCEGSSLHWVADGMRISSVLTEVEVERTVGWTIRTLGARGHQRWTFTGTPTGRTLVRVEECWEGLAARLFRRTLRRTLTLSREEWIAALEKEAAPGAFPPS